MLPKHIRARQALLCGADVVLELAKNPCIIVGRCANMILAEAGVDSINVYLHGPMENKMQRLDEISIDGKPVTEKSMEEHDRKRRTFFKKYTGKSYSEYAQGASE